METPFSFPGNDAFAKFWQDFSSQMMAAGMPTQPQNPSVEAAAQMRRIFFDAMAKHAEEFMRSEAFLKNMKQAMDAGLAWQQSINQAMQKGLGAAQMPSRSETDHIALLVRGMEDRLIDRIDDISNRVAALEGSNGTTRKTTAKRAKVATRAKTKTKTKKAAKKKVKR